MLIDDYFVYQINYEKKYGKNTIVLMQVGSFFEFYGVNNETEKIGDPQVITELLNIQLTRRNKAILENSRSNCLMAGFPLTSVKRFINILLTANYTVILIEQVTEPPNPRREITQIYSPGTYIEEINQSDPNNIISLYITEETCHKTGNSLFLFGIATIDLSTGYNVIYEGNTLYYEKGAFLEEIYRFIESYNPKEIIIHTKDLSKIKLDEIRQKISSINRSLYYETDAGQYFKISYQNSFLKKVFPDTGHYTPIEYLDMENKQYAIIAYIMLLQFSYEHNENIINKIQKPNHWEYDNHLILYNNAAFQLNIVSNTKCKSLFDIINKTSTNMGKRLLKYRLINPITDDIELNKRYDLIDIFLKNDKITPVEKLLNEIIDIERLHRKLSLQILHPYEFLNLSYSYENIRELFAITSDFYKVPEYITAKFNEFIAKYDSIFDMREIGKYGLINIADSFFKKGNYTEIDNIQEDINNIYKYFDDESKKLSNIIETGSDFVKLEHNERDGYFLYATKKRADKIKGYDIKKYNGANVKIMNEDLAKNSDKLVALKDTIKAITKEQYLSCLLSLYNEFGDMFQYVAKYVSVIDVIKCGAKCAKIYRYNRPTIKKDGEGSYFAAKDIRHPIIEVINEEGDYITNDLELKHDICNGILLYGVNGSGKSSLSKAVGCNIVLAQIGFYVPSQEFVYYPYKKIFTRINGDDNIFKGMSSFAVEMDELRSILKYSDDRSIVLGDEICKGTEETSALSIVSASIIRFCKNNVNFIMATHFHKLCDLPCIKDITNIQFKHLTISYDPSNEMIIYGRKLEDGPGSNLYGIEIADYIIDDRDFITDAKNIRNTLLNKSVALLNDKTSNYNNKLYVDACSICGDNGMIYPLDTHHIKEQVTFSDDDFNKDKLSNLVILCKSHHDMAHNGKLEISGYIDTIDGRKLDYKINDKCKSAMKKKFNEDEIKIIKDVALEFKDYKESVKVTIRELKKKGITLSAKTINKICNNEYLN